MKTRLVLVGSALLWLGGCAKPPAAGPPSPDAGAALPADRAEPAPPPAAADSGEWKYELGKPDAKVLVECFFPLNEDHAWVKELNQRIADKWPEDVHVIHYDWWSDEGGKELEKHHLAPCSYFLVDGKVIAAKSQALGGWTEGQLMAAIDAAVKGEDPEAAAKAYNESGAGANEEKASDEPNAGEKSPE